MSYNLFPSFKAIRYFERMTETPFLEIESHPELIVNLLYCCLISHPENGVRMTFSEACEEFIPNHLNELVEGFGREMAIIAQFNKEMTSSTDDKSIAGEQKSSPDKKENIFLSSVIPLLITDCHLDTNYVMNEFDYTDTKLYVDNYVQHYHEEMENDRFWTFLQIAPHLGSKTKIKEAKDVVEFSWEKEQKKEDAEKKMVSDRDKLIELGIIKVEEPE